MTHRQAYLLQGVVFLLVGGILLLARDDGDIGETIATLSVVSVVFVVSALGFGLAWRDRVRERETPRRPSSRWYRAGTVSGVEAETRP